MRQFCYKKQTLINTSFILFLLILSTGLWSCESGDQQIGVNFIGSQTLQINKVDTFTVTTSTVLLDSVSTTNTGTLLVGRYVDPFLGNVSCSSFFQLGLGNVFQPDILVTYDSLVLILAYNYSYGDTNKVQSIKVRELTSQLDKNTTYYNGSVVSVKPEILGSVTFRPQPGINRPLHIKLSDVLGNNIINIAKNGGLQNDQDWLNIFNGVSLTSSDNDNASVLGFNSSADSTSLRLFYHIESANGLQKLNQEFKIASPTFNSISGDRKATNLSSLKNPQDLVISSLTNEQTFLQSGVGVGTRIDFPGLLNFANSYLIGLNQVYLTIKPVQATIDKLYPFPSQIILWYATDNNKLTGILPYSYSSSSQIVGYNTDFGSGDVTYTFDLYKYVNDVVKGKSSKWDGLILTVNNSLTQNRVDRLVLGSQKYSNDAIKLNVYYTTTK